MEFIIFNAHALARASTKPRISRVAASHRLLFVIIIIVHFVSEQITRVTRVHLQVLLHDANKRRAPACRV